MSEDDWYAAADGHPGHGDDDDADREGEGEEWGHHHSFVEGKSKAAVVAHKMLRQVAPLLCATTLYGDPDRGHAPLFAWLEADSPDDLVDDHDPTALHAQNREVRLTDPVWHAPKSVPEGFSGRDYGQYRHRRRLNPETGYVTGGAPQGGSTSVVIQDVDAGTFLRVVDVYLATKHLPPAGETEIRQYATSAKRDGNDRDVDILERVIWMVEQSDDY